MAISKVVYGNTTLIDISEDTVDAAAMLSGTTAHKANGEAVTGNIVSKAAATYTPSASTQSIPSGVYLAGAQTIAPIPISVDNHRLILPEGLISVG